MRITWLTFIAVGLLRCQPASEPPNWLDLPIALVDGYGPFEPSYGILSKSDSAERNDPVRGIPTHWVRPSVSRICFHYNQLVYQDYYAGKHSKAWFDGYKAHNKWYPDSLTYSRKPIRCYVCTLWGYDTQKGVWSVIVDTNNNLDFSDETAFIPDVIDGKQPYLYKNPLSVRYEVLRHGRVQWVQIPVVIKRYGDDYFYNFPQHYKAVADVGGQQVELIFTSNNFTRPDFGSVALTTTPRFCQKQRLDPAHVVGLDEVITLNDVAYYNRGVNLRANHIVFERVMGSEKTYSLQPGYPFRPFNATEFSSRKPIALADLAGKYVYIDFWTTWCKGCVQEAPLLRATYQRADTSRVAFIGIIGEDDSTRVRAFLKRHRISWPQVLSAEQKNVLRQYPVTGYPTSVLLDPNGIVLAKNVREPELFRKLQELKLLR